MNIAIILSGGTGTRLGMSIPKQYLKIGERMIIEFVLDTFGSANIIDGIVIVCAKDWKNTIIEKINYGKPIFFANPGLTRQMSILNGMIEIKKEFGDSVKNVIIHDAARPLVSKHLIESCLSACDNNYDGAMPVLPLKDTVYLSVDKTQITNLLDRTQLFAGQAPEAFNFDKYLKAHLNVPQEELIKINGSSELAFKQGMNIKLIPGDQRNFKITDIEDLERFKTIYYESERSL